MTYMCGCGEADLDQRKQTQTLSNLIAKRLKHAFLLRLIPRSRRIVEPPMDHFRFLELWTFGSGTVGQRNHKVEILF